MKTILKIPFESGNPTGKKGPAEAPDLIAKNLKGNKIDVPVSSDFESSSKNIYNASLKEWKAGNKVLALGGDHSITYSLVKAASKVYKDLAMIYFDAHLDCEDDFLPPSHEDIIPAIVKEKLVKPKNILMVGVRKTWKKEEKFVAKHNIKVLRMDADFSSEIRNFIKDKKNIYISVDIDVVDPQDAPGTNYPEKQGLKKTELFALLKLISSFNRSIGFDICEVSPHSDLQNKTVRLASSAASVF